MGWVGYGPSDIEKTAYGWAATHSLTFSYRNRPHQKWEKAEWTKKSGRDQEILRSAVMWAWSTLKLWVGPQPVTPSQPFSTLDQETSVDLKMIRFKWPAHY